MKHYFCGSTNEIEKLVADLIFHQHGISRAPVWTVITNNIGQSWVEQCCSQLHSGGKKNKKKNKKMVSYFA